MRIEEELEDTKGR